MKFLSIYVIAINLIAYCLMFYDKECARSGQWRIPEKLFFQIAVFGGGIGGTLGMFRFHHKTKHLYFRYGFPIIAVVEGLLFCCLFLRCRGTAFLLPVFASYNMKHVSMDWQTIFKFFPIFSIEFSIFSYP